MLEIKPLLLDEVQKIYDAHMHEAFPPDELKPFSSMAALAARGLYFCYALYENGILTGYAYFTSAENGQYLLLDYFAILRERRGEGLGSKFLQMLREHLKGSCDAVLIEAEDPKTAKNTGEHTERTRRIAFYTRNGCVRTDTNCLLYGVDYAILALPVDTALPEEKVLFDALVAIYHTMFDDAQYQANCHPRRITAS